MHRYPEELAAQSYRRKTVKMLAIVSRLQAIMLNENLTPDELVRCAEAVRESYNQVSKK